MMNVSLRGVPRLALAAILSTSVIAGGWAAQRVTETPPHAPEAPTQPRCVVIAPDGDESIDAGLLGSGPDAVVARLRAEGRCVTTSPGSATVVGGLPPGAVPRAVGRGVSLDRELRRTVMARALLAAMPPEGRASWHDTPLGSLPSETRRRAVGFALSDDSLDEQGTGPTDEAGPGSTVALRKSYAWFVTEQSTTPARTYYLGEACEPPFAGAVPSEPLPLSLLWLLWPHDNAAWSDSAIDLPPRRYSMSELCALLSGKGGLELYVSPECGDVEVLCAAEGARLSEVVWGASTASGLAVRRLRGGDEGETLLLTGTPDARGLPADWERFLLSAGYASPVECPAWPSVTRLAWAGYAPLSNGERSVAWRLADIPALHRRDIEEILSRPQFRGSDAAPCDPDTTIVAWQWGMCVDVSIEGQDGEIENEEAWVPAL